MKKSFIVIFILLIFAGIVFAREERNSLELFRFGAKGYDNVLALCFTDTSTQQADKIITQVKSFIKDFSVQAKNNELEFTLLVAISKNDYTDLPSDVAIKSFVGMGELVSEIIKYKRSSVFIFNTSKHENISYQVARTKAPSWMIQLFAQSINETNFELTPRTFSLDTHNKSNIETLKLFFDENIPSLLVHMKETTNVSSLIENIYQNYPSYFSEDWEQNYFLFFHFDNLRIISEKSSILFIVVVLILIFVYLFLKTIIKNKRLTLKLILTRVCLYVAIVLCNCIFLLFARSIADFIFTACTGTKNIIGQFNAYYLIIFITCWVLLILFFQSFLVHILKKTNSTFQVFSDIYPGSCLLNFFALIVYDFSIYPFTFFTYVVANLFYVTKNNIAKVLVLLISFIPTLLYFIFVIGNSTSLIELIHSNILFLALTSISIVYIFTIAYAISKTYFKSKFFISLLSIVLIAGITILVFITQIKQYKISVQIRQAFTDTGNVSSIKSDYRIKDVFTLTNIPAQSVTASKYIQIEKHLENYLDRSIGTISINSPLKIEALQIFISTATGVAIYEADKNYISTSGGIQFLSSQNSEQPFVINFSSEKDAILNVNVKLFSYDNPFGTKIKTDDKIKYEEKFLLEAVTDFKLTVE